MADPVTRRLRRWDRALVVCLWLLLATSLFNLVLEYVTGNSWCLLVAIIGIAVTLLCLRQHARNRNVIARG